MAIRIPVQKGQWGQLRLGCEGGPSDLIVALIELSHGAQVIQDPSGLVIDYEGEQLDATRVGVYATRAHVTYGRSKEPAFPDLKSVNAGIDSVCSEAFEVLWQE